jgi:hypothetical protein
MISGVSPLPQAAIIAGVAAANVFKNFLLSILLTSKPF